MLAPWPTLIWIFSHSTRSSSFPATFLEQRLVLDCKRNWLSRLYLTYFKVLQHKIKPWSYIELWPFFETLASFLMHRPCWLFAEVKITFHNVMKMFDERHISCSKIRKFDSLQIERHFCSASIGWVFVREILYHSAKRYYHTFNEYQWYWRRMCCWKLISRNVGHVNSFWQFRCDSAKNAIKIQARWFIGVILTEVLAIWRLLTVFWDILHTLVTFKTFGVSVCLWENIEWNNLSVWLRRKSNALEYWQWNDSRVHSVMS